MKRSLRFLRSGIPGFSLSSPSELSSGIGSKKVRGSRSPLKKRIISGATEALMGVEELSAPKRMLIIGLITQALGTITDEEALDMMRNVSAEFDAILSEFTGK